MPFNVFSGNAQYEGADWGNLLLVVDNTTPQAAQRMAVADPAVSYFFYCNQGVTLQGRTFAAGDAVFFSAVYPMWPANASECTLYQKSFLNVGYNAEPSNAAPYVLTNGQPFYDIACIWNVNLVEGPNGAALSIPTNIQAMLDSGTVSTLQQAGMTVLMTVIGGGPNVGWSCFTTESAAQAWASTLATTVATYGLDGIDIDDEYAPCTPTNTSLIMVTSAMQAAMPGKIISKALWQDASYFQSTWNGLTLADTLTYGWYMGYGAPCTALDFYAQQGMQKSTLLMGINRNRQTDPTSWAQCVKQNQYGGTMIFQAGPGQASYLSNISQVEFGVNTIDTGAS